MKGRMLFSFSVRLGHRKFSVYVVFLTIAKSSLASKIILRLQYIVGIKYNMLDA